MSDSKLIVFDPNGTPHIIGSDVVMPWTPMAGKFYACTRKGELFSYDPDKKEWCREINAPVNEVIAMCVVNK